MSWSHAQLVETVYIVVLEQTHTTHGIPVVLIVQVLSPLELLASGATFGGVAAFQQ